MTRRVLVTGTEGQVVGSLVEKTAGRDDIELMLIGLPEGTHTTFELPAGAAFGERNPQMLQWLKRSVLKEMGDPDEQYAVGEVVQFPTPDAQGQFAGTVAELGEEAILFDFNHPLAGQPVTFEVQIIGVL